MSKFGDLHPRLLHSVTAKEVSLGVNFKDLAFLVTVRNNSQFIRPSSHFSPISAALDAQGYPRKLARKVHFLLGVKPFVFSRRTIHTCGSTDAFSHLPTSTTGEVSVACPPYSFQKIIMEWSIKDSKQTKLFHSP